MNKILLKWLQVFMFMIGIFGLPLTINNKPVAITATQHPAPVSSNLPMAIKEGEPAPNFQLPTLEGKTRNLSDFLGKTVLLNFWATWCPPCQAEIPLMQKFYEKYKDQGVEIVAVNLTGFDYGLEKVKNFVEAHNLSFPILVDEDGSVGNLYNTIGIPTSYFIDSKGVIVKKVVGQLSEEVLQELLEINQKD